MVLLDLPHDYLLEFFQYWISTSSYAILNSAFCNSLKRKDLLHILQIKASVLVLPEKFICSASRNVSIKSELQSFESEIAVIFTRKVHAELQFEIFNYYDEQEKLQAICCIDEDTSITNLLFVKTKNVSKDVVKFGMWSGNSARNHFEISSSTSQYQCSPARGYGTIKYKNGGVYWGDISGSKQDGFGTLTCDQFEYEGQFRDMLRDGKGICKYLNGDVYEGEWRDNFMVSGTMNYANGNVFHGIWNQYTMSVGTMIYASGNMYTGEFRGDKRHGLGEFTWANGGYFKGFVNGNPLIDDE